MAVLRLDHVPNGVGKTTRALYQILRDCALLPAIGYAVIGDCPYPLDSQVNSIGTVRRGGLRTRPYHHRYQHAVGQAAGLRSAIAIIRVTYRHGSPLQSASGREYGWRGSMAAALHTARHTCDERVRQSIQHVIARLERRTVTWSVAQNSIHGDYTR